MNGNIYKPACFGRVQPKKWTIRLFISRILVVVCSGLRWFVVVCLHCLRLHYLSSQILVVICGGLR